MPNLQLTLQSHFTSMQRGSRLIEEFSNDYRTYTVKEDDYFGVAIYNREEIEINEKFQNAQIESVKITEDNGEVNNFLLLSSTLLNEKIKFSQICADFIRLGFNNHYREKVLLDPLSWWKEWGKLLGDTKSNKSAYPVLTELWVYYKEIKKGNSTILWSGPSGKNHDFESELYNIEVKSTVSLFSEEITISSQFQLEHEKKLFLYFIIVQVNLDGYSIDDMIEYIVKVGGNIDEIESKLYHLGFPKGYHLRKVKYKILEARSYCIDDNFPIINSEAFIDGKIPLGVKKISYSVDLTYLDYEIIPKTLDMLEG